MHVFNAFVASGIFPVKAGDVNKEVTDQSQFFNVFQLKEQGSIDFLVI